MSVSKTKVQVDENSLTIKLMRRCAFCNDVLDGKVDVDAYRAQARAMGVSFDEYVRLLISNSRDSFANKAIFDKSIHGANSFEKWLEYQQSYIVTDQLLRECQAGLNRPVKLADLQIPFPAIFVTLKFEGKVYDDTHVPTSFLIHQRGQRFDIFVMVDDYVWYIPLDDKLLSDLADKKQNRYIQETAAKQSLGLAWYIIILLSIFRKNPKVISTRKIRLKGKTAKENRKPSEWHLLDDHVRTELLPKSDTPLTGAFNLIDLISPDERPEELIHQATHASPKEHWVKGHTRVYWTGPGRKTPVVREIRPFKRGIPKDELLDRARICK